MPRRFLRLSWYRRNEFRILQALILWAVVFLFYAQHQQAVDIKAQSHHADERFSRIIQENKERSVTAAASAYASCRKQAELATVNKEFHNVVLPALVPDPTPYQRRVLARYEADLNARHILTIPICQQPPSTTRSE